MLNTRLNKAIDRHKSRTVQSPIILWKNFQLRRGGIHVPLATPLFTKILLFHFSFLWGMSKSTMDTSLQLCCWLCQLKNFESRSVFGEVMKMHATWWLSFLGPPCTCCSNTTMSLCRLDYDDQSSHTSVCVIQANYVFLLETLDIKFSGLVGQLYSHHVVSAVKRGDITAEKTSFRAKM